MPDGKRRSQRATPKVQRWVDLLAALLRRSFAATFEELARDVPAYADPARNADALEKLFERDKDELRAFGVPIRTELSADGTTHGYRLDRRDFYLPYVALATAGAGAGARPPRAHGAFYRAVAELVVDPAAVALVGEAARRVESFADPQLAADARAGARKLAFDQPVAGDADGANDARVVDGDRGVDPALFAALGDAVLGRQAVAFDYRAPADDASLRRHVEPYGLHLTGGHWYLVGRDRDRGALRTFRVSRVRGVAADSRAGQARTFVVPPDFRLRDHAGDRPAWSLGDGPVQTVVVEFRRDTGAAAAAMALGEVVPNETEADGPPRRRYAVRRADAFVRWLLSLAGDAVPVSPPEIVAAYRAAARSALARYQAAAASPPRGPAEGV